MTFDSELLLSTYCRKLYRSDAKRSCVDWS